MTERRKKIIEEFVGKVFGDYTITEYIGYKNECVMVKGISKYGNEKIFRKYRKNS